MSDECGHELPSDVVAHTRTGKPITSADLEQWATEAELGYDLAGNDTPQVHHVHDEDVVSGAEGTS